MARKLKNQLNPASLLALIALFVALGGVSYAAATINGKDIKNGTITTKKLKNGTVNNAKVKRGSLAANRLAPAARRALRGRRGPVGPQGPAGAQGVAGPAGAQGPAGTAFAYAQVNDAVPSLVAGRTSGFTGVSRPAVGLYCLAGAPEVVAQAFSGAGSPTRPTVASVEYGNTATQTDTLIVQTRGSNANCPANSFEVRTYRNGAASSTVAFTLLVP